LQDAYEFFQHLLKQVQQNERATGSDPTKSFQYDLQQRLQCMECKRVRYSTVKQTELSLPIPIQAAVPPLVRVEGEKADERAKREAQSKVSFSACVDSFTADEMIEFRCPNCQKTTAAIK
jgi:ubiquitin carboxyl-terminal hydrolase 5/13